MKDELTNLHEILVSAGMTEMEADEHLARFLEEEAYDYVEYMDYMLKELGFKEKLYS